MVAIVPRPRSLGRRKGGGGKGRGSSRGKGSSGSKSTTVTGPKFNGETVKASPSSNGVKTTKKIKSGFFSGRWSGGGTRKEVYGDWYYGCGYPWKPRYCSVVGRELPYDYLPVYYYDPLGSTAYPYDGLEYSNSSLRLGGPLVILQFQSNQTYSPPSVFYIFADNATVISLNTSITESCFPYLGPLSLPLPYLNGTGGPLPEQAVQYYRANSVVLLLGGYNNTAALQYVDNMTQIPVPLPPTVDHTLLDCINSTIGEHVPLVSPHTPWVKTPGGIGCLVVFGVIGFCIMLGVGLVVEDYLAKWWRQF
ncbi:hypothetical protein FA95DRAFT_638769, partial [Auriscalpium vulgare]